MQSQVSLEEGGRGTCENATVLVMEEGPRNPTTQGMQLQKLEKARGGAGFSLESPERASESESHSVMSDSLRPHGLYSPWNTTGQNTGMGNLSFLQGIFPITQGWNPGLPHCKRILYQLRAKPQQYPECSLVKLILDFWLPEL